MQAFNPQSLVWTREPQDHEIKENKITITTAPHTDLWQRTYYHFQNDNAPVLQMETDERYFTAVFTDMALTECQWQAHNVGLVKGINLYFG